jgi:acyl-CoA thioesterase YciA
VTRPLTSPSSPAILIRHEGRTACQVVSGELSLERDAVPRLILPAEANHHGTLYAGSLLRLALEGGYATAWKHVGPQANLVLGRVLNLECLRPVPVGTVIEIEGAVLHRAQAYLVTGLVGTPLNEGEGPWLEALLGFAQVDEAGRPDGLPEGAGPASVPASDAWRRLADCLHKLLHLR